MKGRWLFAAALVVVLVGAGVAAWMTAARRRAAQQTAAASTQTSATATAPGRKISARLYYVSAGGAQLTGVDREVSYADGAAAQAQQIISAQLAAPPAPLVSAIPAGTTLRALYLDTSGEAFVDLSKEVSVGHPGGTRNELLTIYTIVNTLTANLPAITSVQILVDGKEVDTLAGHIDLRKPLQKNVAIIETDATAATAAQPSPTTSRKD